jgi:PAS domain S-box-containing protein
MAPQNGSDAATPCANFQHLADALGDGFYHLDRDGRCTRWNRACEECSGIPAGEAVGRSLDELFPDAESAGIREACLSATETGRPRRTTVEAVARGGVRDLELTVCPCEDGVCVFFRDVTDQVRAERALTEREAAEQKLREYGAALRSLASRISLTGEQERRRVASALHDQIAQLLALSKIKLGVAQESAADARMAAQLQEVRDLIQQALDFTRLLVFDLSPPILYEMGLEAALSRLTEEVEKRYGVPTQFEGDGAPKPLRDDVRGVLFQAARELLINVVKHAGPCRVKVSTRRDDACVLVRVEDDGVGFDATGEALRPREGGGLGLFNVRERLDELGGRLELLTQRGRGTVATLVAPLERGQDDQEGARP